MADAAEARALGPEMLAEGWRSFGDDDVYWMHVPSHRVVSVDPCRRSHASSLPAIPSEPNEPTAEGYCVLCRVHDELGNPEYGTGFWVGSYGLAIRYARAIRLAILDERALPTSVEQQTLDELLAPSIRRANGGDEPCGP